MKRERFSTLLIGTACCALTLAAARAETEGGGDAAGAEAESAALAGLAVAAAQPQPLQQAQQEDEEEAAGALEEIVVVGARRRATLLLETGASVQVFDGERLENMGVRDIEQLTFYAPGTSVNGAQVGFLKIRGVGNNSFSAGTEGSSAFYVDGVYRPRVTSVLTDIVDIERAEVLRGPQGTQFGRNSLGGAINVVTRGPSEEFQAEAEAWAGKFDRFRVQGGMSGALGTEGVRGRLFAMKEVHNGFIENIAPSGRAPNRVDDKDVTTVRGTLEFDLGENARFTLRADWLKSRDTGRVSVLTSGAQRIVDQGAVIPFDDIRKIAIDLLPFQNIDDWGFSGTFEVNLDSWLEGLTLTSVTSRREFDNLFQLDADISPLNAGTLLFDLKSDYIQHETLFTYDAGGDWQGTFGIFYFHEDASFDFDITVPFVQNVPPPAVRVFQTEEVESNAVAVFSDWKWQMTEDFAFNAGLRFSWDKKSHDTRVTVGPIGAPFFFADTGQLPASETWTALTPRVSFDYTPIEDHMFYFLISRGFTAGNFSIGQRDPVDPEFAWNFETGHKAEFFDGRLQTSLSLFWMRLRDLQVELIGENEFDVTTPVTENIGEARNRGVEFQLRAAPAPWFRFDTAVTFLDAVFQEGTAVIEVPTGFQELDLTGNRQTQAPKWSTSSGFEIDFPTEPLGFGGSSTLRFEHQYVGEQFAGGNNLGVLNRDPDVIEEVHIINARLDYEFPDNRWRISFVGENLTDEVVINRLTGTEADFQTQLPDLVEQGKAPGDPRTWAFVLSFRY